MTDGGGSAARLGAIEAHLRWLLDARHRDAGALRAECAEHVSGFHIPQAARSDRSDLHAQILMAAAVLEHVRGAIDLQPRPEGNVAVARTHDEDGWETVYAIAAEEQPPYRLVNLAVEQLPREFVHSTPAQAGATSHRVLLVGNSYTFWNDMPGIIAGLASAAGDELEAVTIAAGGATLEQLWHEGTATARLEYGGPWAAVILQDQSHRPIHDPERTIEYGSRFAELARTHSARPVIFGTWARQNHPDEQPQLDRTYAELADACQGAVAPTGAAFAAARRALPNLGLYAPDGSHPSAAGSYLAARTLYAATFDRSPIGLRPSHDPTRVGGTGAADVNLLQRCAWTAYTDVRYSSPTH